MLQRMELHLSGIKVPKLGSIQDIIYRQFLDKKSKKEVAKNKMLALLAINSGAFETSDSRDKWSEQVKSAWTSYMGLEYGIEIPEHTDHERRMLEYYNKKVKPLKAVIRSNGKKGRHQKIIVEGLESLKE